jgi:hypothetical protein
MDPEEERKRRAKRYIRRVKLRSQVEQRSIEKKSRGDKQVVRCKMKKREIMLELCVRERSMPERSAEEESSSKRHDIRIEVSREDTISSGSRIKENKVKSP